MVSRDDYKSWVVKTILVIVFIVLAWAAWGLYMLSKCFKKNNKTANTEEYYDNLNDQSSSSGTVGGVGNASFLKVLDDNRINEGNGNNRISAKYKGAGGNKVQSAGSFVREIEKIGH